LLIKKYHHQQEKVIYKHRFVLNQRISDFSKEKDSRLSRALLAETEHSGLETYIADKTKIKRRSFLCKAKTD
jgi:hypothetical protein